MQTPWLGSLTHSAGIVLERASKMACVRAVTFGLIFSDSSVDLVTARSMRERTKSVSTAGSGAGGGPSEGGASATTLNSLIAAVLKTV